MNEKMNHKQTALKRLISIVLSITIFVTSFLPFINIAVANSSFQRIPSEYYTASFMYHSQWYDNTQFSHGIQIYNHTNSVIRNWRI